MLQLLLLSISVSVTLWAGEPQWQQLKKTDDGILVFKREIPGSDVIAFRGEGIVDAPIALVATIITDPTQGTQWIDDLEESRVLRWTGPNEFIEYDHVGTPFIMKDRDFVTRATMTARPAEKTFTLEFKSIDDPEAPKTDYIRGNLMRGTFTLRSIENGTKTQVDADVHVDPSGSIPKWIVNFFQGDWPVNTFRGLRKQAAKHGPIHARFAELK